MTLRQVQMTVRPTAADRGSAPHGLAVVELRYDGIARFAGREYRGTVGDLTAAERAFSAAEATGARTWLETPPVRGVQRHDGAITFREDDAP